MRIMLCTNFDKTNAEKCALLTINTLLENGAEVCVDISAAERFNDKRILSGEYDKLAKNCDMMITIGGDGTILKHAKAFAGKGTPILGINSGRLGFMTALESDELNKLKNIISGNYRLEKRMLLNVEHHKNGEIKEYLALNDVVIARSFSKISDFNVSTDSAVLTNIRADGLVFATPTGSTAYSLSAGGPIIEPDMDCIQFTPICPHTLFYRPIIFSPDKRLVVTHVNAKNDEIYFTVDGEESISLSSSDCLVISKSDKYVNLVMTNDNSFFDAVNKKLMLSLKAF